MLVGAAGVGKSRLLAEVAATLEGDGRRVVSVGATTSLSAVPFGVFAGVLGGSLEQGPSFEALQRALQTLATGGDLAALVLAVDDAHLLDDASAGLVLLAARAGARVLATVRDGERCPEAVTRLWKDDFADRIEVQPLDEVQLGAVVEATLGAPLDSHSRFRLFDVTRGNLLFLRELVRHARHTGDLAERGGVWSWKAPVVDVPGVQDLVRDRLARIGPDQLTLVELLAVGEPLSPLIVDQLCAPDALRRAEADGLVVWHRSGRRRDLRLPHPVYAEVVRASLGPQRRAERSLAVADALAAAGARRRDDRLLTAVLRLDGGAPGDAAELRAAAHVAGARADLALSERLARAAVEADGSARSKVLLADVLYWEQRRAEIVELLGDGLPDEADLDDVKRAALLVSASLYMGLGRFDEADAWLDRGIERVGHPHALELLGQRSQMLMFAGRALESLDVGRKVLADEQADRHARLRAYAGVLPSAAVCGFLDEVAGERPAAMGLLVDSEDGLAIYESGGVMVGAFIAAMFSGGLDGVDALSHALHAESVQRIDDPFRGVWPFLLGRSALARGHLADAVAWLRDATALLRQRDPGELLPWALAALTQSLGAIGDAEGSKAALRDLDEVRVPSMHHIDVEIELGRAWAAAAGGERSRARTIAENTGRAMFDDGRLAIAAMALHDAMRLGLAPGVVTDALDAAAEACDGSVVPAYALHARAQLARDFDALLEAARAFEAAGWMLHGAECAAAASRLAATEGLKVRQRDAAIVATTLAARCRPASTPMLETIGGSEALSTLTKREHEVALLAAQGMSKRQIAETLVVSIRTVGNHINHVYGKLGITSREELRAAFETRA